MIGLERCRFFDVREPHLFIRLLADELVEQLPGGVREEEIIAD